MNRQHEIWSLDPVFFVIQVNLHVGEHVEHREENIFIFAGIVFRSMGEEVTRSPSILDDINQYHHHAK